VAGSADADRAEEKLGGHALESSDGEELHCKEAANGRVEEAAKTIMAIDMGNVAVNTRPKALEDAAALSMMVVVANRATANSTDAAKGEEQSTSNVRR
jgi:hypothetical protein